MFSLGCCQVQNFGTYKTILYQTQVKLCCPSKVIFRIWSDIVAYNSSFFVVEKLTPPGLSTLPPSGLSKFQNFNWKAFDFLPFPQFGHCPKNCVFVTSPLSIFYEPGNLQTNMHSKVAKNLAVWDLFSYSPFYCNKCQKYKQLKGNLCQHQIPILNIHKYGNILNRQRLSKENENKLRLKLCQAQIQFSLRKSDLVCLRFVDLDKQINSLRLS